MEPDDIDTIEILCYDGFDELDAIGPYEVFSSAVERNTQFDVRLVTHEPAERVTASHGLRIEPDGVLSGSPDLLVVPGGGWNSRGEQSAWGFAQRDASLAALVERYRAGSSLAAVCTGGMILATAGLLDGRPATTHASTHDQLLEYGVTPIDTRVVDDGDVLTAGGVTAGLDLALWIVERTWGEELAEDVETTIEYDRTTEIHIAD